MSRFVWLDGEMELSQCVRCKHKQGDNVCAAFPIAIPREILENEFDHRERWPGDRGIRFQRAMEGE